MSSEFACPECGCPVRLQGHAAGRRIRCDGCGTLVEVPFLPRVARTSRPSPPLVPAVVWVLAAMVAVPSLVIIVAKQVWRGQVRASAQAEMVRLREPVEQACQADQLAEAVEALDAALKRSDLPWEPEVVQSFRDRRATMARRLLERDLERLEHLGPDDALRDGLVLEARLESEPERDDYRDSVRAAVVRAVGQRFDRDLTAAERACDSGEAAAAWKLADELQKLDDSLPYWARDPSPDRLLTLWTRIARQSGAVVEPIRGSYRLGSADEYNRVVRPILVEALRSQGYPAEPSHPGVAAIWHESAPIRLSMVVQEQSGGFYLQSVNPTAQLEARLTFQRPGKPEWKQTVQAQTAVPLPRLAAYEASHLAVSRTASPEIQQRFHADAFQTLVGRIRKVAAAIPPPGR